MVLIFVLPELESSHPLDRSALRTVMCGVSQLVQFIGTGMCRLIQSAAVASPPAPAAGLEAYSSLSGPPDTVLSPQLFSRHPRYPDSTRETTSERFPSPHPCRSIPLHHIIVTQTVNTVSSLALSLLCILVYSLGELYNTWPWVSWRSSVRPRPVASARVTRPQRAAPNYDVPAPPRRAPHSVHARGGGYLTALAD